MVTDRTDRGGVGFTKPFSPLGYQLWTEAIQADKTKQDYQLFCKQLLKDTQPPTCIRTEEDFQSLERLQRFACKKTQVVTQKTS